MNSLAAEHHVLHEAFSRFAEASGRLEARYEELRDEAAQLRAQLAAKEAQIKQGERLSTLGRTAAVFAHEVRNPLGAITLFLSLLKGELRENSSGLELIQQIERGVESVNGVVSNILQFSKVDPIDLVPVDLHAIAAEQVKLLGVTYGARVTVDLKLARNRLVLGDEGRLSRLFLNLMINAAQATAEPLTITVCERPSAEGWITVELSDNGPGIPEELLSTLFEPFVTGKREGTGLGLAVAKLIMEQHQGQIAVRNDRGARFSLLFPNKA